MVDRIESKLTPSVVVIVDDDAARAATLAGSIRAWFGSTVVKTRSWREQIDSHSDMFADVAILTPTPQMGESADPVPSAIADFAHVPTIVLTDAGEPQRAVNAVLDGASDALVMGPTYLESLPARIRRMLARGQFHNTRDRRGTPLSESLKRSRMENKRLRAKLGHVRTAAMLDPLTGLGNRRLLDQRLSMLWDAAVVSDAELSCLLIDIDNFKCVNDSLGHAAGDRLLLLTAKVLLDQCRQDDIAARVGGDEFVVVLHDASAEQSAQVAERIRIQFEKDTQHLFDAHPRTPALRIEGSPESIHARERAVPRAARSTETSTLSIGAASRKLNRPSTAQELIIMADKAMYAAKSAGKNRINLCVQPSVGATRLAAAG